MESNYRDTPVGHKNLCSMFHRHYPQGFIQDVLLEGGNNRSYAKHSVPLSVCNMLPQEFVFTF